MIDEARAKHAIRFIETCRHTAGEWVGQPFTLMDWQRDIVYKLFGTVNPDGTRQYRTCYIELPRKNGKSSLAARIALYLTAFDGEARAEVYGAANDRDQAGIVYNEASAVVNNEPGLSRIFRPIDSTKRLVHYGSGSFYRAISSEAYTKWGYNAHGIIYDELHAAPDRELYKVLTTSQGARRQPLILFITTAGFNRNSLGWEQHDYACKVRDGIIDDPTYLPVIYAAESEDDWTDESVWYKANPALKTGDPERDAQEKRFRSIEEMRQRFQKALEIPTEENDFRRLYLNQWVNSVSKWMPMDKWDACGGGVDPQSLKGHPCYAGLDLAATTDLTALSLVFPRDGKYDVIQKFWIPADTAREKERKDRVPYSTWARQGFINLTPGNVIDYGFIKQELLDLRKDYEIKEIAFDRWGATKLVQDLQDEGFTVVPFGQGYASMSAPTKELMNLVLSGRLHHGGHPVLRWNADNLVVRQDPAGNIKPDKERATNKIDGCVALIMAIDRATRHAQPEQSVYETRGLLTL